jgi:hypothetical protein
MGLGSMWRERGSQALWLSCMLLQFATASETEGGMDISNYSPISSHRRIQSRGRTPSIETPLPPSSIRTSRRDARPHASPEPWRQDEEISGTALALERSLRLDDAWSSYSSDSPEASPGGGESLSQEADPSNRPRERPEGMSRPNADDPMQRATPLEQVQQLLHSRRGTHLPSSFPRTHPSTLPPCRPPLPAALSGGRLTRIPTTAR